MLREPDCIVVSNSCSCLCCRFVATVDVCGASRMAKQCMNINKINERLQVPMPLDEIHHSHVWSSDDLWEYAQIHGGP